MCDAIVRFRGWREQHPGYFYMKARPELRGEIIALCSRLDLDDAYCFAEDGLPEDPSPAWIDLSGPWEPPQHD